MSLQDDYRVPPLSWPAIGAIAEQCRINFGCADEAHLPIDWLLEHLDGRPGFFELQIWEAARMGDAEGQTCQSGTFIRLREDVYDAACLGDGRARFTLAHEFGHWALHRDLPMQRVMERDRVEAYRRAEPQANAFAARFLMPMRHLRPTDTVEAVMRRFGVSKSAAENRLSDFLKKGH